MSNSITFVKRDSGFTSVKKEGVPTVMDLFTILSRVDGVEILKHDFILALSSYDSDIVSICDNEGNTCK
jgi:hypothetical protein